MIAMKRDVISRGRNRVCVSLSGEQTKKRQLDVVFPAKLKHTYMLLEKL